MATVMSRSFVNVGLAVLAAVLVAGAGFCLFDTDGHDHDGVGVDLCMSIVGVTIGAAPLVALGLAGSTIERLRWAATPVAISIPDPPPWR
jgi:hypothetical protein